MRKCGTIASTAAVLVAATWDVARACERTGMPGPCSCADPSAPPAMDLRPSNPLGARSAPPSSSFGPQEATQVVFVFDSEYSINPPELPIVDATINVGDTIRWDWDSGVHTVTSVTGSADSYDSNIKFPPDTFEHTFNQAGVFWYYCGIHGFDNGDGTADGMAGIITVLAPTTNGAWKVNAGGSWSTGTNWTDDTAPNGPDHTATFGNVITEPRTVSVDTAKSVGAMTFSSAVQYTIDGPGTLTLDVSSGQASITVTAGSHVIAAPVVLADDLTVTSSAGTGLALSGELTAAGKTITKAGTGSAQFENIRAAALNVAAGSVRVRDRGTPNSAAGTSVVQTLSISSGASLDLTNNSAVIDYDGSAGTLEADTREHLRTGRLTSTLRDATHTLGYGDNAVLGKTTFAGQSPDTSSLLIKFTFTGDSDLDGDADGVDIGTWATNFTGELSSGPTATRVWTQGDWDYDGDVDGVDAGLWATAFTGELSGGGLVVTVDSSLSREAAEILYGLGITVVPEPVAGIAFFAVTCAGLLRSRRTRSMQ